MLRTRSPYTVNCLNIGYCDLGASMTGGWELTFYEDYTPCTLPPAPIATRTFTGLPANGCWNLNIDLSGGQEFDFPGGLSGDNPRTFGWGFRYMGSSGPLTLAGFIVAGDPLNTDPGFMLGDTPTAGAGTYYGPAPACPNAGTTGNRELRPTQPALAPRPTSSCGIVTCLSLIHI